MFFFGNPVFGVFWLYFRGYQVYHQTFVCKTSILVLLNFWAVLWQHSSYSFCLGMQLTGNPFLLDAPASNLRSSPQNLPSLSQCPTCSSSKRTCNGSPKNTGVPGTQRSHHSSSHHYQQQHHKHKHQDKDTHKGKHLQKDRHNHTHKHEFINMLNKNITTNIKINITNNLKLTMYTNISINIPTSRRIWNHNWLLFAMKND